MKKPLMISVLLLWLWGALTLSIDSVWKVKGSNTIVTREMFKRFGQNYIAHYGKAELHHYFNAGRFFWLLMPPVLVSPFLRALWRR